jgi:hypothetical protein
MIGSFKGKGGQVVLVASVLGLLLIVAQGFKTQGGAWAVALGSLVLFGVAIYLLTRTGDEAPGEAIAAQGEGDTRFLVGLFASALVIRLIIAFAVHPGGEFARFLGPDEQTFDENGWQFALWLNEETHPLLRLSYRYLNTLQVGYFYLVGSLYYMFGHYLLIPVAVNCLFGALCILPAHGIACDLLDRRAGRYAAVLIAFYPSLILWSTLLIRDVVVILFLLLIFRIVIQLKHKFTLSRIVILCLLLAGLGTLRQYLFLVAGLSVGASFVIGGQGRLKRSLAIGTVVVVGLVFLVKIVGFGQVELSRASFEAISQQRRWSAYEAAGASFHADIDISTPTNALTYLPTGMLWFLFSPFPWQVAGTRQLMALPDVLVWYALFPVTLIGLGHLVRRRFSDISVILMFVIALTLLYSLVEGNVGIIFRHRAQVLAPLMCCSGVGLSLWRRRREEREAMPVPAREN